MFTRNYCVWNHRIGRQWKARIALGPFDVENSAVSDSYENGYQLATVEYSYLLITVESSFIGKKALPLDNTDTIL